MLPSFSGVATNNPLRKSFEEDVAVLDLHGWSNLDLNADEPLEFAVGRVVVDHFL